MLHQDDPQFANWDQDATALEKRYWDSDPATLRPNSAGGRGRRRRLRRGHGRQWARTGRRSNGSVFTVETLGKYFLHDLVHHLHDVGRPLAGRAAPARHGQLAAGSLRPTESHRRLSRSARSRASACRWEIRTESGRLRGRDGVDPLLGLVLDVRPVEQGEQPAADVVGRQARVRSDRDQQGSATGTAATDTEIRPLPASMSADRPRSPSTAATGSRSRRPDRETSPSTPAPPAGNPGRPTAGPTVTVPVC